MYNKIYNKTKEALFERPTYRFHLRELARLIKAHPNSVSNVLTLLSREGIARSEKKKHIVEVTANIESLQFVRKKRVSNFEKIYNSGIIEDISNIFDPDSISVIGSYSRGEDIETSDIDLVVLNAKKKSAGVINFEKFERMLNRKVHLIVTNYKEMSDEFFINLINGILLYGYLRGK